MGAISYNADDKVFKQKTEKTPSEWAKVLDKEKALKIGHEKTMELLKTKYKLDDKSCEAVSLRYQRDKYVTNK